MNKRPKASAPNTGRLLPRSGSTHRQAKTNAADALWQLPDDWSEDRVRQWLLTVSVGGPSVIPIPAGTTLPVAIKTLFVQTPPDRRERIKGGVVLALREWDFRTHGYGALEPLSLTAALIRASGVIPTLSTIIRDECSFRRDHPERIRALAATTAALTGFAPAAELEMHLHLLLTHRDIEPELAGLLFVGLCVCRPDAMSEHVDRFLALRARVGHGFEGIGDALLDAVPPTVLIPQLRKMLSGPRAMIVSLVEPLVESMPEYGLKMGLGAAGVDVWAVARPNERVTVYTAANADVGVFADWVAAGTTTYSREEPNAALLDDEELFA